MFGVRMLERRKILGDESGSSTLRHRIKSNISKIREVGIMGLLRERRGYGTTQSQVISYRPSKEEKSGEETSRTTTVPEKMERKRFRGL